MEQLEARTLLTAGSLDPTFASAGRLHTDIRFSDDSAEAIAIQTDGKIVLAGWTESNMNNLIDSGYISPLPFFSTGNRDNGTDFAVARYLPNGTLDRSFGTDGIVRTDFDGGEDRAQGIAIQPDGRIVVVGSAYVDGDYDFATARYNPDGTLDATFSSDGKRTTDFEGENDLAYGVAIQPDGRIVVTGSARVLLDDDFALVRYTADGRLDTSFSGDGRVTTNFSLLSRDVAYKVALQANGGIVVVGGTSNSISDTTDAAIARYNSDGSRDTSFSTDGRRSISLGAYDVAQAVAIQPDGKIILGGRARVGSDTDFAMARLHPNGSLDTSFSNAGILTDDISGADLDDYLVSILIQPDGRILAVGGAFTTKFSTGIGHYNDLDFAIARYLPNGNTDVSFGRIGIQVTDFGFGHDFGGGVAIQADGKIVVGGASFGWFGQQFAIARYTNNLPDALEVSPNNTLTDAFDLGALSGVQTFAVDLQMKRGDVIAGHLSIHEANDTDWYQFELQQSASAGHVLRIDFDQGLGDLDLELYDASGGLLGRSVGTDNQEEVSLAGLASGTYYLKVYGFSNAANPQYVLRSSTPWLPEPDRYETTGRNDVRASATILDRIEGRHIEDHLSIDSLSDADWYKFAMADGTDRDFVRIDFSHQLGDLNMFLVDSAGRILGQSAESGNREQISLDDLFGDDYYVVVYSDSGTNPEYTLTINAAGPITSDRFEPNNERRGATPLGTLHGWSSLATADQPLSVHSYDDEDWFAFRLEADGKMGHTAAIAFDPAWGDLDIELYDSEARLISASRTTSGLEQLSLEGLEPNTNYYLRVTGYLLAGINQLHPEYDLIVNAPGEDWAENNDSSVEAYNLRDIRGIKTWGQQDNLLSIHDPGDIDWYRFEIAGDSVAGHFARIDFNHGLGDLNLSLYEAVDPNIPLRQSAQASNMESISLAGLGPGTYLLKVEGFSGSMNPAYSLTVNGPTAASAAGVLSGDWSEQSPGYSDNNAPQQAFPLDGIPETVRSQEPLRGLLRRDDPSNALSIHTPTDVDWFSFQLSETGSTGHFVGITFNHAAGDLDLELGRMTGAVYERIDGVEAIGDSHRITLAGLPAVHNGEVVTYLVKVYGFSPSGEPQQAATNSRYGLYINAPGVAAADQLDLDGHNNTASNATQVAIRNGLLAINGLSVHNPNDCDWFKFDLPAAGRPGNLVGIEFDHALGDLDLSLYDSKTHVVAIADGITNAETISLTGRPKGAYWARICGSISNGQPATNPSYRLVLDTPNVNRDWTDFDFEIPSLATDLRRVEGMQTWPMLTIGSATDVDYFRFQLASDAQTGHEVRIDFDHGRGDLDLYLVDSAGQSVLHSNGQPRVSQTATGRESISLEGLRATSETGMPINYYFKVQGHAGATNPRYSLSMHAPSTRLVRADWAEPNDSRDRPQDLHAVIGSLTWTGLSVRTMVDEDWFKFETVAQSVEGHSVGVLFDRGPNGEHDLTLELYPASANGVCSQGSPIGVSSDIGNRQEISLAGSPMGTYCVRVLGAHGATSPEYALVLSAPVRPEPDGFETHSQGDPVVFDNNHRDRAYNLRVVDGAMVLPNLSLSPVSGLLSDEDWYRFRTQAVTAPGHAIRIEFDSALGDLNLQTFDSAGNLLASSQSVSGDFEQIDLFDAQTGQGFPAGEYFVRVTGAAHPGYSLTIVAPEQLARDWAEQHAVFADNNRPQNAYDLRNLDAFSPSLTRMNQLGGFETSVLGAYIPAGGSLANLPLLPVPSVNAGGYLQQLSQSYSLVKTNPLGVSLSPLFRPSSFGIHNPIIEGFDLQSRLGFIGGSALSTLIYNPQNLLNSSAQQIQASNQIGLGPIANIGLAAAILNSNANHMGLRSLPVFGGLGNATSSLASNLGWGGNSLGVSAHANNWTNSLLGFGGQLASNNPTAYDAGQSVMSYVTAANGVSGSAFTNLSGLSSGFGMAGGISAAGFAGGFGAGGYQPACNPAPWASYIVGNEPPCYASADIAPTAIIPNLSLHAVTGSQGDVDWFRFELPDQGKPGQFVGLIADSDLGRLELTLYDALELAQVNFDEQSANPIDVVLGAGDEERLSLAGLPQGHYYIRIRGLEGATNPRFAVVMNLSASSSPDGTEPNDRPADPSDRQLAYDLRQVEGIRVLTSLSLHSRDDGTTDTDWFVFDTVREGRDGNGVRIDFDHSRGDLDLFLLNDRGEELTNSSTTRNFESVSLVGHPAGKYYVRVSGYRGAVSPGYTLTVTGAESSIALDALEPNNRRDQAIRLDRGRGIQHLTGLSIHANDQDFLQFQLEAPATSAHAVTIEFAGDAGALRMELYNSLTATTPLRRSTGSTQNQRISLDGLPSVDVGGKKIVYYLRVVGNDAEVQNRYSLKLDAPTLPANSTDDWTIMVYMTATNLNLYAQSDINELEVAAAKLPGTVNFVVLLDQNATPAQQFPTDGFTGSCVNANADGCWGDTRQAIIQPDQDSRRIITTFERIRDPEGRDLGDQNTGDPATLERFVEWAIQSAPAKRYALILWNHGNGLDGLNFDDSDDLAADRLQAAELAGALDRVLDQVPLANADRQLDLIAFEQCLMAMAEVEYLVSPNAKVIVGSEEVTLAEGFDHVQAFSILTTHPELVDAEDLGAALVSSFNNLARRQDAVGADTLSAARTNGFPALKQRLDEFAAAVSESPSPPWAVLREARSAATSFQNHPEYRDLGQFLQHVESRLGSENPIAVTAKGARQALEEIIFARSNDRRHTSGLSILLPKPTATAALPTDYVSQFEPFVLAEGSPTGGWAGFINGLIRGETSAEVNIDWAEANDSSGTAWNLHRLVNSQTFPSLSIHQPQDRDWFRFFTSPVTGGRVEVSYDHSIGQELKLQLYDRERKPIGQTSNAAGLVSVELNGQGQYFLEVWNSGTGIVPAYSISIHSPDGTVDDWIRGNDGINKAHDLGVIHQEKVLTGLAVSDGSPDWYQFSTPRNYRSIALDAAEVGQDPRELHLQFADNSIATVELLAFNLESNSCTERLQSFQGSDELVIPYSSGAGLSYCLSVTKQEVTPSAYTLHFLPSDEIESVVNHAPISLQLSNVAIKENLSGAVIGELSATDVDPDQTHVFSTSDERFEIAGKTLKLRDGEFITGATIQVVVTVTDSGTPPRDLTQTLIVEVAANPRAWRNAALPLDTNADGSIVPLDALRIINQLNDPTILSSGGRLPDARPASSTVPFYDVNDDGFCSTNDAIRIINYLNGLLGEGEPTKPWNAELEAFVISVPDQAGVLNEQRLNPLKPEDETQQSLEPPQRIPDAEMGSQPGSEWDQDTAADSLESVLDEIAEDICEISREKRSERL